ncbi:MAG: PHP domain-containing protein [Pseudomonadota bacterium]|nr:PHP domain-containing protein [Pseudomonadota bacterium]
MIIDLHTHSTCSDGSLTPTTLLSCAASAGIQVLALTDHDTVAGIEEAQRSAAALGITLVPGVEISASWRAQAVHVLGLWIDPASPTLREKLQTQGELRRARMRKMCARLDKLRLPGAQLLTAVETHPGLPTRAHLAQALVAAGHVATADAAFRRYLGQGKTAYVAAAWPPLEEVLGWIRAAGGIASLAHPARYSLSSSARRRLLGDFAAGGGAALEVVSGGGGNQHVDTCATLAVSFGLSGSVGSDFHSPSAAWNPLGRSLKLPDSVTPVWRSFGL